MTYTASTLTTETASTFTINTDSDFSIDDEISVTSYDSDRQRQQFRYFQIISTYLFFRDFFPIDAFLFPDN